VITSVVSSAVLAIALALAFSPQAAADTSPPSGLPATVSADPLPTVQIDGVAWGEVVVGNTVYVTGSFANARPAGTPASSPSRVARANLLAYDITTGNLITAFNHRLNGQGRAITASPDGSTLYVAGDFTTVDGVTHNRIASFSITTAAGVLNTGFTASLNGSARTVTASNTAVYVGGSFTSANGNGRNRLAAYSSASALLGWNPGANALVSAMTLAPDGTRVVVGGGFTTLAGVTRLGIGAVLTTGAGAPWSDSFPIQDYGSSSNITSLSADGTNVYGTGYYFTSGGNFEGRFAANPTTGTIVWMNSCHGDSYDAVPIGNVLYSAGHQHDCSDMGSFSQDDPGVFDSTHHFLAAETTFATGTLRAPIFTGGNGQPGPRYFDFSGQPSGTQLQWDPGLTAGTYTGQSQAAWTVAGNAGYLAVGGEFPTANGTAQQGLVRYAIRSAAPNRIGPTAVTAPTAVSQRADTLRVSWRAAADQDNSDLTYELLRDGGTTPITTVTYSGSFWQRPMLGFTDTSVAAGSTHTYRIRVSDLLGNSVTSAASAAATVGSAAVPSYTEMVRADGATDLWRLSETGGSTAVDSAGFADMTTKRLVKKINYAAMHMNAITSGVPDAAKVPMPFATDREAIETALGMIGLTPPEQARVVRIKNTLALTEIDCSEALLAEVKTHRRLRPEAAQKRLIHACVVLQVVEIDVALQDLFHGGADALQLLLDGIQHNLGMGLDIAWDVRAHAGNEEQIAVGNRAIEERRLGSRRRLLPILIKHLFGWLVALRRGGHRRHGRGSRRGGDPASQEIPSIRLLHAISLSLPA